MYEKFDFYLTLIKMKKFAQPSEMRSKRKKIHFDV